MRWLFLPVIAGKPWNGNTVLTQPLGGSESAVVYIAQALQAKGEECTVVSHGDALTDYRGVRYVNQDYNAVIKEQWDIVVSSRWPQILENPWKCGMKLLWLHDLPSQQFNAECNGVVFVSKYQQEQYGVWGDRAVVIPNGVDDTLLWSKPAERSENVLIWASNPDRGLCLAAHIFQEIRKRWPDMELHVYGRAGIYGWDKSAEAPYMPRHDEMENVVLYESLPRTQLFNRLAGAHALFYPTFWPETHCMTALESQFVGTPVIASPFAALNETVHGGILTYDFLNAISQLRNKRRWEKLSVVGYEWARQNTWACQADKWMELVS